MRKTILIIDDDIVSQFASRYTIQQCNSDAEIIVCDGAQEGLDILSDMLEKGRDLPEFIFLDLEMPELDGWDFLDRFRLMNSKVNRTKVFILSAFTNSQDRKKAMQHAIVEGFYDKPLSRDGVNKILTPTLD